MEVMRIILSSVRLRFRIKSVKVSCIICCYGHWYLLPKDFTVLECTSHVGGNRDVALLTTCFLSSIEFYSWNLLESSDPLAAVKSGKEDVKTKHNVYMLECLSVCIVCVYSLF